jgi:hypothetical protein
MFCRKEKNMPTKLQRIAIWIALSVLTILGSATIELLAEINFNGSWFHKIASYSFAGGSTIGGIGVLLAFGSLALSDFHEGKSTKTFVNLGRNNDRIISVNNIGEACVHLPVTGDARQTIIAQSEASVPYVSQEPLEHTHFGTKTPTVRVMSDDLYQSLFGNIREEF